MTISKNTLVIKASPALHGELPAIGEFALPGDKSLSHRAALLGAMADGESRFSNFQVSGVTRAMLTSLEKLGVGWELQGDSLRVSGIGLSPTSRQQPVHLDCGNSATTLRLLAGALAAWGLPAVLDGSAGLRRRPMGRIVEPLRAMGLPIADQDGCAPLQLQPTGAPLQAIHYRLPVASAQVKSCLLLAGLKAEGETVLIEPGPSRDHTERMLGGMGVKIDRRQARLPGGEEMDYVTRLAPATTLRPLDMTLPGDMSAAAFLIVAALITPGSQITLRGVGLNPTRTGLLDVLLAMGADIQRSNLHEQGGEPLGDLSVRYRRLHGVQISGETVVRMIDEFPVLAVAAAYADGWTEVSEALELRHKESDRISALCHELSVLGVKVSETTDGFVVQGGKIPRGGQVEPHGDHRLAMSLAVAGLAAQNPVHVVGADILGESFPNFPSLLRHLGADLSLD